MKKTFFTAVLLGSFILYSCSKDHFQSLLDDPNRSTTVNPSLLLTNVAVSSFAASGTGPTYRAHIMGNAEASYSEEYFTWDRGDYGIYTTLLQVNQMKIEAAKRNLKEYLALAKFFDAFNFYKLTMQFGDIPYSEALQAAGKVYNPKYDTQKEVFLGILKELDAANKDLIPYTGAVVTITGDVIYKGDVLKWRKLINSFALRVLITLSAKTADADLQVVQKFQNIVNNPTLYPLFQDNTDNGQLTYYNLTGNNYPVYKNTTAQRAFIDERFANFLIASKDPRLFSFASQTVNAVAAGKLSTDFSGYGGADASLLTKDLKLIIAGKNVSSMNGRYTNDPAGEPYIAVGYAELQFNLAEAAYRGWINKDPETFYKNGIKASMSFYESYGAYKTSDYFDNVYANAAVVYNAAAALSQIMMQKYISFFMNSHEEAYFNIRRTGLPAIKLDGGGVQNGAVFPKRWMYPQTEIDRNNQPLADAIQRQFPDGDNINGVMWLLK